MAIERGTGSTTAYAANRYAPRNTRTVADGSPRQISWITDMVREIHKLQVRNLHITDSPAAVPQSMVADAISALGSADDAVSQTLASPLVNGEHGTIPRLKATLHRTREMNRE